MSGYVVDTNIISEAIKAKPDPNTNALFGEHNDRSAQI